MTIVLRDDNTLPTKKSGDHATISRAMWSGCYALGRKQEVRVSYREPAVLSQCGAVPIGLFYVPVKLPRPRGSFPRPLSPW
mgnify:CR=1 FL=1